MRTWSCRRSRSGGSRVYNTSMEFDAVVVGSGPNGLAAAIEVARAGYSVCVLEAADSIGGGARSAELTLPGFIHDVCSAIHPLGVASPFFKSLPLADHGLKWIVPPVAVAHPLDNGKAALLEKSIDRTGATLGDDAKAYSRFFSPFLNKWEQLLPEILSPPFHLVRHPFLFARFGLNALQSAQGFAQRRFTGEAARALFGGIAAHANMPLNTSPTAAFGILLGMLGHAAGWPMVKGGSQKLSDALGSYFTQLGGKIVTGTRVKSLREIPQARAVFLDITPLQILKLAAEQLPPSYRWELHKYRYGPGVFKVDWALSSPIPWKARECLRAATLHLGGSLEEISAGEDAVAKGRWPERPYLILAQQSLFDDTRAPGGKHTAWAYCHVPRGSKVDMTERIESQIERFAPGFRDCIMERHTISPAELETYNANCVGGDISGGVQSLLQIVARPSLRLVPYAMPIKGMFICSSSTPPGGGVHGMCGYNAARAALSTILYNRPKRLEVR